MVGTIVLAAVAYQRASGDPGLTTELALVLTVLLGGLSIERPELAGGLAVVLAVLLAARSRLHRFVRTVLTEQELEDALIFAGASLVVLPLVPDRAMGPYGALNPHQVWIVVILIMAISAVGHLAVRLLGARYGLPIAGFASGFVSSTATIGAMGARAANVPDTAAAAAAGAVLSTVATIVQLAAVLAATSAATLQSLAWPLACAGVAAVLYGVACTIPVLRQRGEGSEPKGRAFSPATALAFASTLAIMLLASAALQNWFGAKGVVIAAAVAGFVDVHSVAISIATLVASGKMSAGDAIVPILAGLTTNTISKIAFAVLSGGWRFAARVVPGLIIVAVAAWSFELYSLFSR